MKRFLLLLLAFLSFCLSISLAQTIDATVCEVLANPQSFDGKIVRIKGTVVAGLDEFAITDPTCKQNLRAIWLAYPEGTKAKAGALAVVQLQAAKNSAVSGSTPGRAAVKLDRNKDFKEFDALLSTPHKGGGICLGCGKYVVKATLTGRLDGVAAPGVVRDATGKITAVRGFGNMNYYTARLVLQSVTDISQQEIDYSRAASLPQDDTSHGTGGDPVALAHQEARAFPAGSPAAEELERAAAAYGKEGEDNGVVVGFGIPNEVPNSDGLKGNSDSPDGILYNCTFDMDRLKGDLLPKAIVHIGSLIADLRSPQATTTLFDSEYRAWQTTVLSALAMGQKTVTLPGGYVIWNASWAPADRSKMVDQAVSSYLRDWAVF